MEPYNPNRPTVSWKEAPKDKSELLDRLQEAGVPFTAALKYFYDNPEGPASETLNMATDETVPFKWQLRTGNATPASLAEEAVMLAMPVKGGRKKVNVTKEGPFNELKDWADYKVNQYNEFLKNNPNERLRLAQEELNNAKEWLRDYPYMKDIEQALPNLELNVTEAAIDALDASPYYGIVEDWGRIPEGTSGRLPAGEVGGPRYVYNRLVNEYGPELGTYYYHKLFQSDYQKYPHPQDIGVESGLLNRMFNKYYK